MTSNEIREKYINYFIRNGHKEIKGAPLIPENDPSVLFTTAGMHPLVPYLLGEKHPEGNRLVNYQKCLRTGDIDEVGDETHLTFFEMLGNWSLNDYFKEESIKLSYNFLINELKLDKEKIGITVFKGDSDAPRDEESALIWRSLGISKEKIAYLDKKHNWWGPVGETGPCGPDTEIFYWRYQNKPVPSYFDPSNDGWVEIWNNVFMEYNKTKDGYIPSPLKNVDTGMGLERITTVLENKERVYETELFCEAMKYLDDKIDNIEAKRIILDHMRASIFLISDGVIPSNTDQGYVLRRLLRRSIRLMFEYDSYDKIDLNKLYDYITNPLENIYHLQAKKHIIITTIEEEFKKYRSTTIKGEREFNKIISTLPQNEKIISGEIAFRLFDTYGLPIELTIGLAKRNKLEVDIEGFNKRFKEHQEKSKQGADKKFKGGLVERNEETAKLHTATHLLHKALKIVLGDHVHQKGSNITEERLRFDFSHHQKLTEEELNKVENIVNEVINKAIPVTSEKMSKQDAINSGAECLFIDKYGDVVTVYSIGDFSKEICGGPHASNTKDLGVFKIIKEEAVAAGVRRIKAILINK
jgi:alanyl-tRNA synthetase